MARKTFAGAALFGQSGWMGSTWYLSTRKYVYGNKRAHKYRDLIYVNPKTHFEGLTLKLLILLGYYRSLFSPPKKSL